MLAAGQRGEQQSFILALVFFVPQRLRGSQRRIEENLAKLAPDNGFTVGATQEGDRLDVKALFRNIDQQGKALARMLAQIVRELPLAFLAVGKSRRVRKRAGLPAVRDQLVGTEIEQLLASHVLILLMTS